MNTSLIRALLAAVMLLPLHGTVVAADAQGAAGTSATTQVNEADFKHQYVDVAGQKMHYVTAGKGEPVLLIPGWPQTWYAWRHVMTRLAAEGYMAIAVDPPGTGYSARPTTGYDTGAVATTLHRMMNQLGHKNTRLSVTISVCGWVMRWRVTTLQTLKK